jgi:hypothetical protein
MAKALELLYRTTLRILVLKNADAVREHERVIAVAIDLNLTGSGHDTPSALLDLKRTVWGGVQEEWREVLPSYQPDPHPDYAKAFEDRAIQAIDGDSILNRLVLLLEALTLPSTDR